MSYKPPYTFLNTGKGRRRLLLSGLSFLTALLIFGGIYIMFNWFSAGGLGSIALFASDTPTATITPTASSTPTITMTPTITATFTLEPSPSAAAPFLYTVQLDDTLSSIAEQFDVEFIIIMALNGMNNDSVLFVGQELIIPDPNTGLPNPTALPEGLPRGAEIDYLVLSGDTLASIADQFLSTEEDIIETNELENSNLIFVGQLLKIPVNLITATPGPSPTPTGSASATSAETATPAPEETATPNP
jgi:LysM repeat protein